MFVVQLAITSIIFVGLLISNVLTVVLIAFFVFKDIHSNLQGADYYIASLAISDLIFGVFVVPFSLVSLSWSQWAFGQDVCEFYAYMWLALWLVNIYTFFSLSADRSLYTTDKKYCQYKNRTRVRCICEIFLAWSMALSFSFVPATLHDSHLSTISVDQHICTIYWHKAIGYFAVIIIASVVPCLLWSMFNFTKIYFWRMRWKLQKTRRKLSGAAVQHLFEPTHDVCLVLFLVFWSSWIPFAVDIYGYLKNEEQSPSAHYFWIGGSQGIWKFPIMIIFCPRYRQYISAFGANKAINVGAAEAVSNGNVFAIECISRRTNSEISHAAIDDIELHL